MAEQLSPEDKVTVDRLNELSRIFFHTYYSKVPGKNVEMIKDHWRFEVVIPMSPEILDKGILFHSRWGSFSLQTHKQFYTISELTKQLNTGVDLIIFYMGNPLPEEFERYELEKYLRPQCQNLFPKNTIYFSALT